MVSKHATSDPESRPNWDSLYSPYYTPSTPVSPLFPREAPTQNLLSHGILRQPLLYHPHPKNKVQIDLN